MNKYRRYNIYLLEIVLLITLATYLFFIANCFGSCSTNIIKPLFVGSLGLAASVLVLLCFPGRIFISWLKHIAWWFLILTAIMVMNTSSGGFLPIVDRIDVTIFWMALLFVITTLYALIMNHHLK